MTEFCGNYMKKKNWPKASIFFCGFVDVFFKVMTFLSHLILFLLFFFIFTLLIVLNVVIMGTNKSTCLSDDVNSNLNINCECECLVNALTHGSKYYSLFGLIHVFRPNFSVQFIDFAFEMASLFSVPKLCCSHKFIFRFLVSVFPIDRSVFPFCHDL